MRSVPFILAAMLALAPGLAGAQTSGTSQSWREAGAHRPLTVEAAAGLTTQADPVVSAAVGYSPFRLLTFVFEAERLHVPREITFFPNGSSERPGFTAYMFNGQARLTAPINRRVSVYGMVGLGRGVWGRDEGSRHDGGGLVGPFLGGGVRASVRPGLSVFASAKAGLLVGTDTDSLWGYLPIQGGVAWDF
jgi:hypothetical protein